MPRPDRHRVPVGDLGRSAATASNCPMPEADVSYEEDPEYLEHARLQDLEDQDQPELPWDA